MRLLLKISIAYGMLADVRHVLHVHKSRFLQQNCMLRQLDCRCLISLLDVVKTKLLNACYQNNVLIWVLCYCCPYCHLAYKLKVGRQLSGLYLWGGQLDELRGPHCRRQSRQLIILQVIIILLFVRSQKNFTQFTLDINSFVWTPGDDRLTETCSV